MITFTAAEIADSFNLQPIVFCIYADHLAEVAELRAKLATVERETIERCAAECERWMAACEMVSLQHAMTGAENLRAAHFSEAIARLKLAVAKGHNASYTVKPAD